MTISEVEDILRVGRSTILKLLYGGMINGIKVGKQWRVTKEALEEYLHISENKKVLLFPSLLVK